MQRRRRWTRLQDIMRRDRKRGRGGGSMEALRFFAKIMLGEVGYGSNNIAVNRRSDKDSTLLQMHIWDPPAKIRSGLVPLKDRIVKRGMLYRALQHLLQGHIAWCMLYCSAQIPFWLFYFGRFWLHYGDHDAAAFTLSHILVRNGFWYDRWNI